MKKRINHSVLYAVLGLAVLLLTGSCTRRELEYPALGGNLTITFDWKNLMSGESIPENMKICFYGSNGTIITKDCTGTTGFSGTLPAGTYQILAYNSDGNGTGYEGLEQYTTAEGTVSTETKAFPATRAVTYLIQPSHVYAVGLGSVTVSGSNGQSTHIVAAPVSLAKKVDIKIKVTGQTSALASFTGTIDGIVQKIFLSTGVVDAATTGLIDFTPLPASDGYVATVSFFGKVPGGKNMLTLLCNYTGGGSETITQDISTALDNLSQSVVEIQLDITINITGTTPGNFQATLKDWSVENREIIAQ